MSDQVASRPFLRIRDLTKRFGRFTALDGVSLDVAEGELLAFLGPSGCGKTTLLRAIAGLDVQSSGTIEQAGRDISRLPVSGRDFGIVFQSYALFPNLTIAGNVGYGLAAAGRGNGAAAGRVQELLGLVGLADQGAKYPAQLSGGQQQRVALARALALDPGLLLLDEPLSALDARVRTRLRSEIRALQRRLGITTILVTHDQEEALTMADRIAVMRQGRIEQVGTPDAIYRSPATAFVADFVGKMNFWQGALAAPGAARVADLSLAFTQRLDLAPGAAVTVCLRPEDVVVRGLDAGTANQIEVEVGAMEFSGSYFATRLERLDGGFGLTADLSANAAHDLGIVPGRRIRVALPPDRLRLFPGGPG